MNKKIVNKIQIGVLVITAGYFLANTYLKPFKSDQAREIGGYIAILLVAASLAIIVPKLYRQAKEIAMEYRG